MLFVPTQMLGCMLGLDHLFLLNVFLFAGRLSMSLVMEYLPHGSLIGYLENNRHNVNTRRMLLFASQICKVRARHTVCAELLNLII